MPSSTYLAKGEDTEFEIKISESTYLTLESRSERNPTELELFSAIRQILAPMFYPANPRIHPARFITKDCHGNRLIIKEQTTFVNGSHYPSEQTVLYEKNAQSEIINLCAPMRDLLDLMVNRRELRTDFIEINSSNYNDFNLTIRQNERHLLRDDLLFGRIYFYDTSIEELPDIHITVDNTAITTPLLFSPQFVLLDRVYLCQIKSCEYCLMECARRIESASID